MAQFKKKNLSSIATEQIIDVEMPVHDEIEVRTRSSNKKTANQAVKLLVGLNQGYLEPNNIERINLLIAFAKKNKVLYGKAFDVVKVLDEKVVDLSNLLDLEKNLNYITVCEIKSTTKKGIGEGFNRYFFGLTTAELLVAQSLRDQFTFVFVNINTKEVIEMPLSGIFARAKGIYPVWSIQF